jgi:Protein of unknown function (DUF3460)
MRRLPVKIVSFTLAPALWCARHAAMPLFWKAYKSDVTSFIEELKANKPTLEEEQRQGRNLLWDKRIDRDAQAEYGDAKVPQQPYVYQTKA